MRDEFKSSITIKVIDTEKLFPELLAKLRNSVDDKKGPEWDRIKDALYRAKELTVQSSELPGFRVAGSWRFLREDLETWIAEQKAAVRSGDVDVEDDGEGA